MYNLQGLLGTLIINMVLLCFVAIAMVMLCVQVYIFDRLTNKRYENFMSVLDIYLNKHFSAALAFK